MSNPEITETPEQLRAELERLRARVAELERSPAVQTPPFWFDQVNDAIFITDTDWRIVYWNKAAERLYGWPTAQAIGQHIDKIIPIDRYMDGINDAAQIEIIVRTGGWRGVFLQRTRDRRELVIDGATRAFHDDQGAIKGYIGINRDITERHQVQAALRISEERFRAIIENGAEAVLLVSADRQIRYVSPSISRLLGYSIDQVRTLGAHALTHPDDWPELDRLMGQVIAKPGATEHITARAQHQDGSWRWLERSAVINLEPGQVTEPIRSSSGYHILQLVDRAPAPAPPFEQIRDQVLEAYRRRAADDALRAYLDDLRSRAHIEIAPDLS